VASELELLVEVDEDAGVLDEDDLFLLSVA